MRASPSTPPGAARPSERPLRAFGWMALASGLFATMNLLARLSSGHVPWTETAAVRSLVGALTTLAVARATGASLRIHHPRLSWARSLCGTGALMCTFYTLGAPKLALGDAATLFATSPLFIAFLSPWLLGERSGGGLWLSTLLAFGGVTLVLGPQLAIAWDLAAIATFGSVLTAFAMIWLRKLGSDEHRESPEAIALHFALVALVVLSLSSARSFTLPDATGALLLLGTGLTGGVAQLAMTRAYALDRAARVGAVGYLGVALSHLLGGLVLGEPASPHQLLGAALVVAAGLLLARSALRDARTPRVEHTPLPG